MEKTKEDDKKNTEQLQSAKKQLEETKIVKQATKETIDDISKMNNGGKVDNVESESKTEKDDRDEEAAENKKEEELKKKHEQKLAENNVNSEHKYKQLES